MAYRYVAYTPAGDAVKGRLEVESKEDAEAALNQADLILVSLTRERRLPPLYQMVPTFFSVKGRDRVSFSQQLASLLEAGVPLTQSLRLLHEQATHPQLRQALRLMIADLEQGSPLSEAIAKHPAVFPSFYQRILAVGEETGALEVMFRRLASYMEKQASLVARIRKALTYPAFVIVVGIVSMFILMTYSLPAMMGLFEEFQAQLPLTTRILLASSRLSRAYGVYTMVALAAGGVLAWLYVRTPRGALRRDAFVLRLPIIGNIIRNNNTARISSSLATLLGAGVQLLEGLDITAGTMGNRVARAALQQVRADLMTGVSLSQALVRHPSVFPPVMVQMIRVGEATGGLHKNLEGLVAYYESETDRAVDAMTSVLEPGIVVVIGLGIGFVAVSVVTPMYSLISQIR